MRRNEALYLANEHHIKKRHFLDHPDAIDKYYSDEFVRKNILFSRERRYW